MAAAAYCLRYIIFVYNIGYNNNNSGDNNGDKN